MPKGERFCLSKNQRVIFFAFFMFLLLNATAFAEGVTNYYFAYGSNLSYAFLKERLKNGKWVDDWHKDGILEDPIPIDLGTYVLPDYEFGYTLNLETLGEKGTSGNILSKKGSIVYGVLYLLSDKHLKELDLSEDVPRSYERVSVKVHRVASLLFYEPNSPSSAIAWVYVGNPKYMTDEMNPDPIYEKLLIEAALERHFPQSYIEKYLHADVYALKGSG